MKRIISVILCVMIVAAITATVASAATPTVTCTADKTTVAPGEEVTLKFNLKDCPKIASLGIRVKFDKNVFELISGKWTLSDTLVNDFNENTLDGVAAFSTETDNCNGEIFTLKLKAKVNADLGTTDVYAELVLRDKVNKQIPTNSEKTTITVDGTAVTKSATETQKIPTETTNPGSFTMNLMTETLQPEKTDNISTVPQASQVTIGDGTIADLPKPTDREQSTQSPLSPDMFETLEEKTIDPPSVFLFPPIVWIIIALVVCFVVGIILASSKKKP